MSTARSRLVVFLFLLLLCLSQIIGCSQEPVETSCTDSMDEQPEEVSVNIPESPPQVITTEEVEANIEDSAYLDGIHWDSGVDCIDCHEQLEAEQISIPSNEVCIACHGSYEELAEKLMLKDDYKNYNPHASPHGEEKCYSCHHMHSPFELSCRSCHSV